ncbi:23S rRNA (uracil(1939)-C(5))-methyltransferase RlmD [Seminavis robusta]|uniref:23S rRNA (Uracil(1939)-C(5))-methyltransferase RlmD n=1 Tax=Seminavis robusta TaxID=568900 RepID=A0A9N8DKP2_9STRA|nr:23S rRNA (uracil(1939)-C(5))-methyltransferase RlmD [Seminavis robusta]|eukprot:Sro197_g083820.1 23S rRNA (uracil(1939)-C(5))-methyltransferase RlmD (523) ;mRNA; r:49964-51746
MMLSRCALALVAPRYLFPRAALGRGQNLVRWHLHSTSTTTAEAVSDNTNKEEDANKYRIPRKFVSYPFDYHEELTVQIDTLTNLGMGIARIHLADHTTLNNTDTTNDSDNNNTTNTNTNNTQKWVIMVPNVIPGETVVARIFRNHKSYSEADLISVVEASPDRIPPTCPLASECGGCQYQHMPVALQRHWKTKHVQECFQQHHVDLPVPVQPTMGTDQVFGYRSKITPHFQAPGGMKRRKGKRKQKALDDNTPPPMIEAIGFQRRSVRSIIDVPSCPIATAPINEEYQRIRNNLLHQPYHKSLGATLLLRQANVHNDTVVTDHNEYMTTTVNDIDFTYQAGNFFQNNLYILPQMVDLVMEQASAPAPDGQTRMTHFVDCYCGSGLFCLSAAQHFDTCVGIEINKKAIQEATQTAANNLLQHKCTFEASRAEAIFDNPHVQTFPRDTTVVMLDPPRKGSDELFLKQLQEFGPQRIVYLSCNPATQARDVQQMVSWGYEITLVQPIDLFPQTRHIESLTVLERL